MTSEQQGEPVCPKCGHRRLGMVCVEDCGCSCVEGEPVNFVQVEGDVDPSLTSTTVSNAEPTPPSSEEAEAQAWGEFWDALHDEDHNPDDDDYSERAADARIKLRAAIRRPLEERVRELERDLFEQLRRANTEMLNAGYAEERAEVLVEERDRLREQVGTFAIVAADGHAVTRRRAEAAEAQVTRLTEERDRALDERDEHAIWANELLLRAEAAEAQVVRLREAALELLDARGPVNYEQAVANVIFVASRIRAETVQEGGETGG